MSEKGFPQVALNIWAALFVPKATPAAAVERLRAALDDTMQDPIIQKAIRGAGYYAEYRDAQATSEMAAEEARMIRETVAKLRIKE